METVGGRQRKVTVTSPFSAFSFLTGPEEMTFNQSRVYHKVTCIYGGLKENKTEPNSVKDGRKGKDALDTGYCV